MAFNRFQIQQMEIIFSSIPPILAIPKQYLFPLCPL